MVLGWKGWTEFKSRPLTHIASWTAVRDQDQKKPAASRRRFIVQPIQPIVSYYYFSSLNKENNK
jgi:hypothetical protein